MGWAGGSHVCQQLVALANKHVAESSRAKFFDALITIFEDQDCDTLCEVEDDGFEKRYRKWLRANGRGDYDDEA